MRPLQNPMQLASTELLVLLMKRTGDGRGVSVRDLAEAADCHPSKIDHLRNGRRQTATQAEAEAIARRLGVDLMCLWEHTGRTIEAPTEPAQIAAVPA
ncbi:helix-turn-helix domain-containing protein [Streptomyces sp. NPDC087568]|uniref:helix-turn-helix domain-containing protein n=1 Tax=Streptomyces sp. NPDC087568 TaxID=3365799 RepID=UPI0038241837